MQARRILLPSIVVAAALAGTVALATAIAQSGDDTGRRLAVDAQQTLSAGFNATQVDQNMTERDRLARELVRVDDYPRIDPGGWHFYEPLPLDQALIAATRIVIGSVREQYIEIGAHPLGAFDGAFLVSVVHTDTGEDVRVAQVTGVYVERGVTYLVEQPGETLLAAGERYAVVVQDTNATEALEVIRAHAYGIDSDGNLIVLDPAPDSDEVDGSPAEVLERRE